jgi:hypothetical protein
MSLRGFRQEPHCMFRIWVDKSHYAHFTNTKQVCYACVFLKPALRDLTVKLCTNGVVNPFCHRVYTSFINRAHFVCWVSVSLCLVWITPAGSWMSLTITVHDRNHSHLLLWENGNCLSQPPWPDPFLTWWPPVRGQNLLYVVLSVAEWHIRSLVWLLGCWCPYCPRRVDTAQSVESPHVPSGLSQMCQPRAHRGLSV